jgi:two-component system LytT family sensor kinase
MIQSYTGLLISFLISKSFLKGGLDRVFLKGTISKIIISIIVFANIWYLIVILLDLIIKELGYQTTGITFEQYHWEVYTYLMLLSACLSGIILIKLWDEWKNKKKLEQKYQEIKENKIKTELEALKLQLNPHFLFNVLNTIYSNSIEKSDKTPEIVIKFSNLLSYVIYDCQVDEIELSKEIEFIRNYLDIEKSRFENQIEIKFKHNFSTDVKIPPLLFLPLIENTIKHSSSSGQHRDIEIELKCDHNSLVFETSNPYTKKFTNNIGVGLQNVSNRLKLIYGNNAFLDISNVKDKYIVKLLINFKKESYANKVFNN